MKISDGYDEPIASKDIQNKAGQIPQEKRDTQVDPISGAAPRQLGVNVPTQENQGTKNLQEDMFNEVGHELEGFKDSPLDKRKS